MKFKTVLFMIFLFLLISCAPDAPAYTETPKMTSTFIVTQTATQTPSPTATLSPKQQITAMVNKSKETGIFPTGLTEEQERAWFEELNRQRGEQPLAIADPENPGSILVYVPPSIYPNFKEEWADEILGQGQTASGPKELKQYGDCSNTFRLANNFFDKHPEVAEKITETKWIQMAYEKNANGEKNGNLMFYYNEQWTTVNGSELLTKQNAWQTLISQNGPVTLEEAIASNLLEMPNPATNDYSADLTRVMEKQGAELIPAILLPLPPEGIPRLQVAGETRDKIDALPMLRVHLIPDQNGSLVPVGEKIFVGTETGAGTYILKSGSDKYTRFSFSYPFRNPGSDTNHLINQGEIYYIAVYKEQAGAFEAGVNGLSKMPALVPQDKSYEAITETDLGEEAIILTMPNSLTALLISIDK